jgi:hypothetical protein
MYACVQYGVGQLFASETLAANCSCDPIDSYNYCVVSLNETGNIGVSAEIETPEEVIELININSGNSFTTLQECVSWSSQNNYLIFYQGQVAV